MGIVDEPVICICGHAGVLRCEETNKFSSLRERCWLIGFDSHPFTVCSTARKRSESERESLLMAFKAVCPNCGTKGALRYT